MAKPTSRLYRPENFTPTKWSTGKDKARFVEQFAAFVNSDFNFAKFPKTFYTQLSNTFGHIAHYNQHGFYEEFFRCPQDIVRFLRLTVGYPCFGDPAWTFCDAEKAIQRWLEEDGTLARWQQRLADTVEAAERAELNRLQTKYAAAKETE